jgi:N-acetylmuramoyl-L-alanine amidase
MPTHRPFCCHPLNLRAILTFLDRSINTAHCPENAVYRIIILVLFTHSLVSAQDTLVAPAQALDSLYLRVVIPEEDTVQTKSSRYRIAASTLSSAQAFINRSQAKVHPSGAFVGLVDLPVDTSTLRLLVTSSTGDSLWRDFTFIRDRPMTTSSRETLTIARELMMPRQDQWLGHNDVIEVRFKGSPGYQATFEIEDVAWDLPMMELPKSETRGIEGIYVGRYVVREDDEASNARVRFKLRKSFWSSEKAYAPGMLTISPSEFPRVAEVRGRRPYLNVGLGSDRLGGAKFGYIQPGARITITGSVGRQYRVRLSESMEAWIPRRNALLLPTETPVPRSLTGSIGISGDAEADYVTVGLSERLPYTSDQQVNPPAVTVDIFGATSNTNWITQQTSAKGVESVSWDQVGTDHYRLTIALAYDQHWGYDIRYIGTSLQVKVRRPPLIASMDTVLTGLLIAVDAGHGGDNRGALGSTGVLEKDVNLAMANHLDSVLTARGASVYMTRIDGGTAQMTDRVENIVASNARILVSIHCNSVGFSSDPENVYGTGTFYRYIGFQPLANIMMDKMIELGVRQFGVVGSFNFTLNSLTQMPNVLLETMFLSNPEEEMLLLDDEFRKLLAVKAADGLEEFVRKYGLTEPLE